MDRTKKQEDNLIVEERRDKIYIIFRSMSEKRRRRRGTGSDEGSDLSETEPDTKSPVSIRRLCPPPPGHVQNIFAQN